MDDGLGFFKSIGLGAGVIGIYTFLHLISHETFTGTFPVDYSQGSWQTYSLVAVLVVILMMTALGQILLPHFSSNHWIRKLYVHSSRGFYIAVIADKWIARLYKDRTFSRPSRTSKAFYARLFSQQAFLVDGEQNHFLLDTNRPFCHGSRV